MDKHLITATPDIVQFTKESTKSAAYLILACDGVWDVMNNEQVANFVSKRVSHTSLQHIASQLLDECLILDTMDNTSIYIVKI
jgi:serine/threonine protein phosphatase PrpC